jgi:hypothetical protein
MTNKGHTAFPNVGSNGDLHLAKHFQETGGANAVLGVRIRAALRTDCAADANCSMHEWRKIAASGNWNLIRGKRKWLYIRFRVLDFRIFTQLIPCCRVRTQDPNAALLLLSRYSQR